ncbi:SRPBCC family protein [Ulvibacterium marinum]|uniref:SRPBCC family protein n=1 Tax=Ulvibacterium marinum TaxID=2419782 RepID=UPI0024950E87|nr:SRPBCC domain-containing protein [Ulvibacterium marinum]
MDITHNLHIKAKPEKIYLAVTTKNGISGWWSKDCSVGESEGKNSLLKFDKQGTLVEMGFITLELVPHEKAVWECISMPNPAWIGTTIHTEIRESVNGCDVVFSHRDFDQKWQGQEPFEQTKATWNHFMDSLVSFCEKGKGQPW